MPALQKMPLAKCVGAGFNESSLRAKIYNSASSLKILIPENGGYQDSNVQFYITCIQLQVLMNLKIHICISYMGGIK